MCLVTRFTISTQGHEARPAPKASVRWSRVVCVSKVYKMYLAESMQMPSSSDVFHHASVILIVLVGVSCAVTEVTNIVRNMFAATLTLLRI